MYDFLLLMWVERKITKDGLAYQVERKRITQEQYETIISTPQTEIK